MSEHTGIQELTLEEVMGDRFGRYSKYIIQERALPDIRDGLKPVQRRILFAMNEDGNTYDKGFRKSAKSVGNIMGNYHPHGDSSIYEAMVRMSQDWKLRETLIDMHGNNGSMDGDSPAAMRYTEVRLSEVSGELLADINKDTVDMVWNFDDTEKEPTVLPAKFPNLLVNGSTGISAGYATEIPTHNLGEVIDGVIYLLDHPNASLEKLMTFILGPDFPTGGILMGTDQIKKAYETGKGKVVLRSKTDIEAIRGGREQIVITEIPYEVNKASLVKKLDEIRLNKKIDGMSEVRDETDRTGLRIVIELKKGANAAGILQYLFKNTDLQINYNFNMVAIDHRRPQQVGLKRILESYIDHRRDVILRRSRFELDKAQKRAHIVEGLIKALSILDEIIQTIRQSKDKKDSKKQLMAQFDFTEVQAEAIVVMQLYRLSNTDVVALQKEAQQLEEEVARLQDIMANDSSLIRVIKEELRTVKKKYANDRLTRIEEKVPELKIEADILVANEQTMVAVTKEGYVKRSSLRSYQSSGHDEVGMKEGDTLLYVAELNTRDHLLMLTTHGQMIYRPVHEITELKWKEVGDHISQSITNLSSDEEIMAVFAVPVLDDTQTIVMMTRFGMIKQTSVSAFKPWRSYKTKATCAMKLKDDDQLIAAHLCSLSVNQEVIVATQSGYGLRYLLSEVSITGAKAAGVKSVNLKENDVVAASLVTENASQEILIVTQRGAMKRMNIEDIPLLTRAKRGVLLLKPLKRNAHEIRAMFLEQEESSLCITTKKGTTFEFTWEDIPLSPRESNGKLMFDEKQEGQLHEARWNQ